MELDKETFWRSASELSIKKVRFNWSKNWCKGQSVPVKVWCLDHFFQLELKKCVGCPWTFSIMPSSFPLKATFPLMTHWSVGKTLDPKMLLSFLFFFFFLRYNELPSIPLIVGTLTSFGKTDFEFSCLQ